MNKINEELKREISKVISLELKNPNLKGLITVTQVETTPDLRYAKVFVSMIGVNNRKDTLGILKRSSGFIRSEVARTVNLRNTPELVFVFDESIEYGARIDNILKDITKDMKKDDKGE
ncbi:MAG: 30S ribosome-binding factor RbfA [Clostridia bacterium]|nr:30S ribosome-binding factor RbfA [Clostridia bacterium]